MYLNAEACSYTNCLHFVAKDVIEESAAAIANRTTTYQITLLGMGKFRQAVFTAAVQTKVVPTIEQFEQP